MSYLWYWPSGGWDFDAYRRSHPWQPVYSDQSGKNELLPLLRTHEDHPVWEVHRHDWLNLTRALLGPAPTLPAGPVRWSELERHERSGLIYRHLRYTITGDELGYAWLLLPAAHTSESLPVILALHQTVPQGKDEAVGLHGNPELAYGQELACRGFAVLAPDAIGFGERLAAAPTARYHSAEEFFDAHPGGSVMGKMAFDVSRAIDLLEVLPEVDASRIGCIGHSHGGYGSLFGMILDHRIRAGVVSCGISVLRSDPTPERWWRRTALIPRLGFYEGRIVDTPLDFHHWIALAAPRPLMITAALEDSIFPGTDNVPGVLDKVGRVYAACGSRKNLHRWIFHGDHCFPRTARTRAYQMLEGVLHSTGTRGSHANSSMIGCPVPSLVT